MEETVAMLNVKRVLKMDDELLGKVRYLQEMEDAYNVIHALVEADIEASPAIMVSVANSLADYCEALKETQPETAAYVIPAIRKALEDI